MNKFLYVLIILLFSLQRNVKANDCSTLPPFEPKGLFAVTVTVESNSWKNGEQEFKPLCKQTIQVPWFDVRGREDDAYNCLKPKESEVVSCPVELENEEASITVVPASWVRKWDQTSMREYRFHAYSQKNSDPLFYLDIFSRALSESITPQKIIIEGSLTTDPNNSTDGYWIRADFNVDVMNE